VVDDNPGSDVIAHEQGSAGVEQFIGVYRLMVAAMPEAAGETAQLYQVRYREQVIKQQQRLKILQ